MASPAFPDVPLSIDDLGDGDCSDPVVAPLAAGTYTVSEVSDATGYDVTYECTGETPGEGTSAVVQLSAGEAVTCTFTNSHGTITICKDVVPPDGSSWTFDLSGQQSDQLSVMDGACGDFELLAGGSYTVTETTQNGFDVFVECDDESSAQGAIVNLELPSGGHITCMYTNTNLGNITIIKQTLPDGSGQSFDFTSSDFPTFPLMDGQFMTFTDLQAGDYDFTETVPVGWDLTNISCEGGIIEQPDAFTTDPLGENGITIHLETNDDVTCTFTNTQLGEIEVCKQTEPDLSSQLQLHRHERPRELPAERRSVHALRWAGPR